MSSTLTGMTTRHLVSAGSNPLAPTITKGARTLNRTRWLLAVLLGAILVTAGVGAVIAASPEASPVGGSEAEEDAAGESENDDSAEDRAEGEDVAIGDPVALERASAAALAYLADQGLNGEVTAPPRRRAAGRRSAHRRLRGGRPRLTLLRAVRRAWRSPLLEDEERNDARRAPLKRLVQRELPSDERP